MKQANRKQALPPARAAKMIGGNAKDAILDAALKAFARDGFDGASLPKIAEMAGIAHPLIHYHFRSKDNLWRETVDWALGGLIREAAAIGAASRGLSPLDRLQVLIRAFTHFAARCPDHFGLIIAEARTDSERLVWLRENYADDFLNRLKDILKEAQAQGQISDVPIDHLAFIIMGGVLLYFTTNFEFPKHGDLDAIADRHAELLSNMVLRGIAIAP